MLYMMYDMIWSFYVAATAAAEALSERRRTHRKIYWHNLCMLYVLCTHENDIFLLRSLFCAVEIANIRHILYAGNQALMLVEQGKSNPIQMCTKSKQHKWISYRLVFNLCDVFSTLWQPHRQQHQHQFNKDPYLWQLLTLEWKFNKSCAPRWEQNRYVCVQCAIWNVLLCVCGSIALTPRPSLCSSLCCYLKCVRIKYSNWISAGNWQHTHCSVVHRNNGKTMISLCIHAQAQGVNSNHIHSECTQVHINST